MTDIAVSQPIPIAPKRSIFRARGAWVLLVLLTLVAGVLRLTSLDRPTIWGDESATAGRVVGSYQELVDQLAEGSFTPLHYEVLWWVAQGMPLWGDITTENDKQTFTPSHRIVPGGITLTPFFIRLIPAICGTLMIPAIYFLSRQLFGQRVSLVAATLTCFSAYLLIYSRDAKMYMPFWFLCTLNVACLLWWLRVRTWTAWLCWVAAGAAMLGYHALGSFVLIVNVLIYLTAPRQYWSGLWKLLLLLVWPILLGVAALYETLRTRFDLMIWWRFDDVLKYPIRMWPGFRFPTVLLFAGGMFLITVGTSHYFDSFNQRMDRVVREDGEFSTDNNGTGWVEPYNQGRAIGSLALYTTSAYLTGWEWPRNQIDNGVDDESSINPRTLKLLKISVVTLLVFLAMGMLPWRRMFSPARARLERISQDNRVDRKYVSMRTLWVGGWLLIPAFAMYAQSVERPAFILDAVSHIALKQPAYITWPRLPRAAKDEDKLAFYFNQDRLKPFSNAFGASWGEFKKQFANPKESLAKSRLAIVAVVIGFVLVMIVWRRKIMLRTSLQLLFAAVTIILICGVLTLAPRFADKSVWMSRYVGLIVPAFLLTSAALIVRLPTWWLRAGAVGVFVIVNGSQYIARVYTPSEAPTARFVADILASNPPREATTRAFVNFRHRGVAPGWGTFPTGPSSYYFWLGTQKPGVPASTIRHGTYQDAANIRIFEQTDPAGVASVAERAKQIDTVIVWTSQDWNQVDTTDPIEDKLRGLFRRVSDDVTPVYDHWRWMHLYDVRRREYVRINEIRPQPEAPAPAPK